MLKPFTRNDVIAANHAVSNKIEVAAEVFVTYSNKGFLSRICLFSSATAKPNNRAVEPKFNKRLKNMIKNITVSTTTSICRRKSVNISSRFLAVRIARSQLRNSRQRDSPIQKAICMQISLFLPLPQKQALLPPK